MVYQRQLPGPRAVLQQQLQCRLDRQWQHCLLQGSDSNYWCVNSPAQSNTYTVSYTTSTTPSVEHPVDENNLLFRRNGCHFTSSLTAPNHSWKLNGTQFATTNLNLTSCQYRCQRTRHVQPRAMSSLWMSPAFPGRKPPPQQALRPQRQSPTITINLVRMQQTQQAARRLLATLQH